MFYSPGDRHHVAPNGFIPPPSQVDNLGFRGARLVLGMLLLAAAGCANQSPVSPAPGEVPSLTREADGIYRHDAGQVLSGEVVSRAFAFTNTTDEPLVIQSDADIRTDCGGSGVKPEARDVSPGASTNVVVTVHTAGKHGPFSSGGTIFWSAPSGKQIAATF